MMPIEWTTWANSKYFTLYYDHKTIAEAENFLSALVSKINITKNQSALDICCGTGRYSVALNKLGLRVVGIDFSPEQIKIANQNRTATLNFYPYRAEDFDLHDKFDFAFNMFTSFGYQDEDTNIKILKNIYKHLKSNGKLVIDYWNPSNLKYTSLQNGSTINQEKLKGSVRFETQGSIKKGFYLKEIKVFDGTQHFIFNEQIMAITLDTFKTYFNETGFTLSSVFGSYNLDAFEDDLSDRMILIVDKWTNQYK